MTEPKKMVKNKVGKKFAQDLRQNANKYVATCKKALQTLKIPEPDHDIHKKFFISNYRRYGVEGRRSTLWREYVNSLSIIGRSQSDVWLKKMQDMHCADAEIPEPLFFDSIFKYANELQEFVETLPDFDHLLRYSRTIIYYLEDLNNREKRIQQLNQAMLHQNQAMLHQKSELKEERRKLKEYLQKHDIDLCCDMPSVALSRIHATLVSDCNYVHKQIMAFKPKSDL